MKKFLLFIFLAMAPQLCAQTADTVLLNGKVLTVDPQFSIQEGYRDTRRQDFSRR